MELLSPAGSYEAVIAAVQSGADAIYLGGMRFGARGNAKNFTVDEMKKWIDYCHIYGVKAYVTVNTLIKEREIDEFSEYVRKLSDINVDAFIVQDFGAVEIIKQVAPEVGIHASTQMTATTLDDVEFLHQIGFSRVVLARELSFSEIKYICENTSCEIEIFIHGALCMCYSGQCLFSSIIGGRSGNRGFCAQPCRLPYTVCGDKKDKSSYILSPKDLCLITQLDKIKKSGVLSLKIEGRLKRAEYVGAVTGIYRKYIDNNAKVTESDMTELENAFGRGFTLGKFGGDDGMKMMSFDNPSNKSENIFSDAVKQRCREDANIRKVPITLKAELKVGNKLCVTLSDGNNSVECYSEKSAEEAMKVAIDEKRLKDNLLKFGNTPFVCCKTDIYSDGKSALPISEVNLTRRKATEELISKRINSEKRKTGLLVKKNETNNTADKVFISCSVYTKEQVEAAVKCGIKRIYIPDKSFVCSNENEFIIKCGEITKTDDSCGEILCISNAGEVKKHYGKKLHGSLRLNITNSLSADFYGKYLKSIILSPELKIKEIEEINKNCDIQTGVMGYGRLELMLCENCPLKAAGKCQNHKNVHYLKDRMNEKFPLICTKHCQLKVLNSKPIYMADKLNDLINSGISFINLDFTIENKEECERIIKLYQQALKGESVSAMPENTFTRGHFYRGIK